MRSVGGTYSLLVASKDLGIDLVIIALEFQSWIEAFHGGTFRHIASAGSSGLFVDPLWSFDEFNHGDGNGTHWNDSRYRAMLDQAKATPDPAARMARLSQCERHLMQEMPILPLAYWVEAQLRKPYVRGLGNNLLGRQQFKYVWIDTKWRPQ